MDHFPRNCVHVSAMSGYASGNRVHAFCGLLLFFFFFSAVIFLFCFFLGCFGLGAVAAGSGRFTGSWVGPRVESGSGRPDIYYFFIFLALFFSFFLLCFFFLSSFLFFFLLRSAPTVHPPAWRGGQRWRTVAWRWGAWMIGGVRRRVRCTPGCWLGAVLSCPEGLNCIVCKVFGVKT
ncbi:hypothetical protein E1A91_D09G010100v1 [Gossypium mustelinum]|uniref:Uncharacterized protein n=1 Tax=Gossypium mustelinum TaxID=34275 RepID=A0A5D2TGK4_GOSMU|nr:hypothetical protein E1A91_D09G010100v1 [Gossypium mustelinum]